MSGCDFFSLCRNILVAYFESFCRKKKGAYVNCRAIKHAKCASNAIRISDYAATSREIIAGNPFSDSHKHDMEKSRLVFSLLALKFNSRISFSRRFLFVRKKHLFSTQTRQNLLKKLNFDIADVITNKYIVARRLLTDSIGLPFLIIAHKLADRLEENRRSLNGLTRHTHTRIVTYAWVYIVCTYTKHCAVSVYRKDVTDLYEELYDRNTFQHLFSSRVSWKCYVIAKIMSMMSTCQVKYREINIHF